MIIELKYKNNLFNLQNSFKMILNKIKIFNVLSFCKKLLTNKIFS